VNLPAGILDAVTAHCREAYPEEACGIIFGWSDRDEVHGTTRMRNVAEFPRARYEFDPDDQVEMWQRLDGLGQRPRIIYHSHPRDDAQPSPVDRQYAQDPEMLHLIVGHTLVGLELDIKLWRFVDGGAVEVPYTIVERVEDRA
jgi:proteasome lid subunit RPN8/RPN11